MSIYERGTAEIFRFEEEEKRYTKEIVGRVCIERCRRKTYQYR
jgi:hypothetical protein